MSINLSTVEPINSLTLLWVLLRAKNVNPDIIYPLLRQNYEQLLANNDDIGLLAQTMFELARCFHKTGCLGQAKIYFKDSIRLYQRLEQPTQVAAATSALGNLELQMGAIDDARIHLQTALEFYQAAGNLDRVASIQDLQQCLPEYSPEPAI
jgi:tetratricopeptide (TPR) repeat protein